jgi:hypothetical protein
VSANGGTEDAVAARNGALARLHSAQDTNRGINTRAYCPNQETSRIP